MNFVAADLGASGTRYVSNSGKIQVLPNNMVALDFGTVTLSSPLKKKVTLNISL